MDVMTSSKPLEELEGVAVRFAGDSGDGMQIVGSQFTNVSAIMGNDLATLPDYPAEIRAPAGTLAGVSGFQIHFSSAEIFTPGDTIQVLVAMNPAALRMNLGDLEPNGIIVANTDGFNKTALEMAKYAEDPLKSDALAGYRVLPAPITQLTREAVKEAGLKGRDADRCKNFFALGLVFWLFDRDMAPTLNWLQQKFGAKPDILQANTLALKAGYNFGETTEAFQTHYRVRKAQQAPGLYRKIRGSEALALGLIAAAHQAGKSLFYGSYPITPASDMLHEISRHAGFGVRSFQAEDEIAAMCATIGAAYGGDFAVTGTSGPGLSLKTEAMGLAVMLELPLVIVDAQRGGPSTGLPTKTEQSDLLAAVFGRHGESPLPVIAAQSPADCFETAIEAFQIATAFMTPVILLTDGYLGNGAEPWRVPQVADLPRFEIHHPAEGDEFQPYSRDSNRSRPWALPGTRGLAHRIGGLEKEHLTGEVNYEPENHELMSKLRRDKILKIADFIPEQSVLGDAAGELLVVSWGSGYGAARTAVEKARAKGLSVSHANLRHMNPFPRNLGAILKSFKKVLVCELNLGQLDVLLRAQYLVETTTLFKIQGRPFAVKEILDAIENTLQKAEPIHG